MRRLLGLLVLAGACGGPAPAPAPTPTASPASATADLEALYRARQDSARMRFSPVEVDFMTGMIAHHAQALIMADLAPGNGAGPSVRTLTARIINAQRDEIATMQRWLADRGQPVPEVHIDGLDLMIHGVAERHHHMPGMLTPAQLEELATARGREFDRLFLVYMIQHHRGAVTMVQALFAADGAGRDELAFRLASDIQADQLTEIERMEDMLAAMETSR